MRLVAALLFSGGLVLAVRVMFFGVRRSRGTELVHRAGPLSIGAVMIASGALLYAQAALGMAMTAAVTAWVVIAGTLAGLGAWWVVRASVAAAASATDPDDDPRYRLQGYVARVVRPIGTNLGGRIALVVDGQPLEFGAQWLAGSAAAGTTGAVDSEVVIEHVDGDVAHVEPWALVEGRL